MNANSARTDALRKAKAKMAQEQEDDPTKDLYYMKGSTVMRFRPEPGVPYGFDSSGNIVHQSNLLASYKK